MMKTVVMPAYNEEEGIAEFIREILGAFDAGLIHIVVVDDASTDGTFSVVTRLEAEGLPVTAMRNEQNLGHGPSTIRALVAGLETGADVIVAVDGDGQFSGADVARVAGALGSESTDVVEGVRIGRSDPPYRRVVSLVTRELVRRSCGSRPVDANTPLRAYPHSRLRQLIEGLPELAMTPNILISASVRRNRWTVRELEVASLPRRGSSKVGSSWGASLALLPSRRFLTFCWQSFVQWRQFESLRPLG